MGRIVRISCDVQNEAKLSDVRADRRRRERVHEHPASGRIHRPSPWKTRFVGARSEPGTADGRSTSRATPMEDGFYSVAQPLLLAGGSGVWLRCLTFSDILGVRIQKVDAEWH